MSSFRLKNIEFTSIVTVSKHHIVLGEADSQKITRVRSRKQLGRGVIVFEHKPYGVSVSGGISHIRNMNRKSPAFFTILRPGASQDGDWNAFLDLTGIHAKQKIAPFGIIADFSIAKPEESYSEFLSEIRACAIGFACTPVPLLVQISITVPPDVVREISEIPGVDGLVLSEYIPWSVLPNEVRTVFFDTTTSPYQNTGGGFVVGKYWTPIALEWIAQVRRAGVRTPVVSGGFLRARDASLGIQMGFTATYVGVGMRLLRPWQKYWME
jgi:hypothetical protein